MLIRSARQLIGGYARRLYLGLQSEVVEPWILTWAFSPTRLQKASEGWARLNSMTELLPTASTLGRIWFHAASVGELESLWPLILICAERGSELILTVLSESADRSLDHLVHELKSRQIKPLFAGYSPWEGKWGRSLDQLRPSLFITARYEAWPDLWVSLSDRDIPLSIVAARDRRSLRIAQRLCRWMGRAIPQLLLFPSTDQDKADLEVRFPGARIENVGDPRWDRVFDRGCRGSSRASELVQAVQGLPRPWGILGSVWLEDLKFLFPKILKQSGTVWVVPHRVDSKYTELIGDLLSKQGLRVVRTYSSSAAALSQTLREADSRTNVVLVNEIGFLSELYSAADWAWVGGGFGKGIHSALEPAIHGIPVAVGPRGIQNFPEVQELSGTGQLTVVSSDPMLERWVMTARDASFRLKWESEAKSRLGAALRIYRCLESGTHRTGRS